MDFEKLVKKYEKSINPTISDMEKRVHAKVFSGLDAHSSPESKILFFKPEVYSPLVKPFANFMKNLSYKHFGFVAILIVVAILPISLASIYDSGSNSTSLESDLGDVEQELGSIQKNSKIKVYEEYLEDNGTLDYGPGDVLDLDREPVASTKEDLETEGEERIQKKDGYIYFKTKNPEGAFEEISKIPEKFDGYLLTSSYKGENSISTLEFRVPSDKFEEAVKFVKSQGGDILEENISTSDRQNQLNELQSTKEQYKDDIERLNKDLENAKTDGERNNIKNQIELKKSFVENTEESIEDLTKETSFSTLSIKIGFDDENSILSGDFGVVTKNIEVIIVFWLNVIAYLSIPAIAMLAGYKLFGKRIKVNKKG